MRALSSSLLALLGLAACGGGGGGDGGAPLDSGVPVNWRVVAAPDAGTAINGVAWGNQTWVAVGSGVLASSPDGNTWTAQTLAPTAPDYHAVAFGNGMFVGVGGTVVSTTTDGIHWTPQPLGMAQGLTAVTYGGSQWVIADDRSLTGDLVSFWTSTNGTQWAQVTTLIPYAPPTALAYGNGKYVLVGAGGLVATSADGFAWGQQSVSSSDAGPDNAFTGLTFGNGMFVAVTLHGSAYRSADGVTWTQATAAAGDLNAACFGNGVFVAVGNYGAISTSLDGAAWSGQTWSGPSNLGLFNAVAYGGGSFVAVGSTFGVSP